MASFRIGQRVKYVRRERVRGTDRARSIPLGTEGWIVSIGATKCSDGSIRDCSVQFDSHPEGPRACYFWQLEVPYDGNQKISFDECLWKPEMENA